MKVYTGEEIQKPHQCKECEKCFSTTSGLKSHERTHTKEQPFTCEHCGKQFKFCGALRHHVNSLHEGRKDFLCHICGKCFAEKVARDNHIRVHTGERPFRCEICGKDFKKNLLFTSTRNFIVKSLLCHVPLVRNHSDFSPVFPFTCDPIQVRGHTPVTFVIKDSPPIEIC